MRINPTPTLTMSSKKSESGDAANAAGGSGSGSNGKDANVGGSADLGLNRVDGLPPWDPPTPRPRADAGSLSPRHRTSLRSWSRTC